MESLLMPYIPISDPLLWSEGMLLTPQHFQQSDLYQEKQRLFMLQQVQPYYWGLSDLSLKKTELEAGLIQVEKLVAIMKDGLCVQFGKPWFRPYDLQLDISQHADIKRRQWVMIHLLVPLRVDGAAAENANIRRFKTVQGDMAIDDTNTDGRVALDRLQIRAQLWAGDNPPAQYESLPLCKVALTPNGNFEIVNGYLPPLLRASAADFIGDKKSLNYRLKKLIEKLRHNANYLATTQQLHAQNLLAFTTALPPLETLVNSRMAHPFTLLGALAGVYGCMCALRANPLPAEIPAYDHHQAAKSIYKVVQQIHELIDSIPLSYKLYRFQKRKNNIFGLFMPQGWNTEQVIIEIVPAQGQSPIEAEEWLNNARIGSRPVMELLRRQRSPGAWTGKLSQEIRLRYTQRSQAQLYEVRNLMVGGEDRDQPAIQSEQPLIIWGDNDLQAPEAILLYRPAKSPVGDAA
jgi:type VI secretion system protein ImpJ